MEQLRMIHKLKTSPEYTISEGFKLRFYQPGDEEIWTKICKFGLLEENEGIECWEKYMLSMDGLLPERDVYFIDDDQGNPVATCTQFFVEPGVALLHMLGALPEARGKKLATTMTVYGLQKAKKELDGEEGIMRLKSDDWRVSAVKCYLQCGFQPVLFDVDMDVRWKAICDKLDFHGVEMLDDNGDPTGVIL